MTPEELVRKMELSARERRELEELRAAVLLGQQTGVIPRESEPQPQQLMMSSPLTLTAGGIQYAVEITTKE